MDNSDSIAALTANLREFARERDWEQFHDPKSLVLALVGEVGELAELLQWIPADGAVDHFADPARKRRAGEEMADVLTYLVRLADVLDIDIADATWEKLEASRVRFAPEVVKGHAPRKP
ncbi:nucleotide pyrophosphohydrolase [Demequina sp. TTPB684]|uniref:nucleotide pyrophosphohydrolase n=1 Tax=unclassified Demequina TaxID=2620311 RepID=UPI001CF2C8C2|nr:MULTISPECIES: nucleotide pyrophosphohydrolase [unclassified Demequina]MCB2413084.1 nucleotide pyrophosphohydrolase [Demequina sp. TTPB684]UPU88108.1 nucleotide pyrophosphohydrolase [Demequina sp. TMPB413]